MYWYCKEKFEADRSRALTYRCSEVHQGRLRSSSPPNQETTHPENPESPNAQKWSSSRHKSWRQLQRFERMVSHCIVLCSKWFKPRSIICLSNLVPRVFSAFKMAARRRPWQTAGYVSLKILEILIVLNRTELSNWTAVCQGPSRHFERREDLGDEVVVCLVWSSGWV